MTHDEQIAKFLAAQDVDSSQRFYDGAFGQNLAGSLAANWGKLGLALLVLCSLRAWIWYKNYSRRSL